MHACVYVCMYVGITRTWTGNYHFRSGKGAKPLLQEQRGSKRTQQGSIKATRGRIGGAGGRSEGASNF